LAFVSPAKKPGAKKAGSFHGQVLFFQTRKILAHKHYKVKMIADVPTTQIIDTKITIIFISSLSCPGRITQLLDVEMSKSFTIGRSMSFVFK